MIDIQSRVVLVFHNYGRVKAALDSGRPQDAVMFARELHAQTRELALQIEQSIVQAGGTVP